MTVKNKLLDFLNDQRFRWISSLILLLGFFIGSLQDINYEFSFSVLEGMFPLFYIPALCWDLYIKEENYIDLYISER